MLKKYDVCLGAEERAELERLVRSGVSPARKVIHARILLKADEGDTEGEVAGGGGGGGAGVAAVATVERVRKRFAEGGPDPLGAALDRRP